MESWCTVFMENQLFLDKINLKMVSEPFTFLWYARNFGVNRYFIKKHSLHIHKQPTEYVSNRAPQQAGVDLFS